MSDMALEKISWSIDSLVYRKGTFFGFGWAFHKDADINRVQLSVRLRDGSYQLLDAEIHKPREDLASYFPQFPQAHHAGFLILGSIRGQIHEQNPFALLCSLDDGTNLRLNLSAQSVTVLGDGDHQKQLMRKQFSLMLKRAWFLFRNGRLAELKNKAVRQMHAVQDEMSPDTLPQQLMDYSEFPVTLLIDHDLGGGANHYRERVINERLSTGSPVIILSFKVSSLELILILRCPGKKEIRYAMRSYEQALTILSQLQIGELIYNTGVSFSTPEAIPDLLLALKNKNDVRLVMLVHDFFTVCPSHFLLDQNGQFCGVPGGSDCDRCLKSNHSTFASLYRDRNIAEWRRLWGAVYDSANEIVVFSNSSLQLLKRSYPALNLQKVFLRPHDVSYIRPVPLVPKPDSLLKIGVVGQIGYHKGAKFLQELAEEINKRKSQIKIAVIGEMLFPCDKAVVSQTGQYDHNQLPALIEQSGANVMLFPSICPETFSYVVNELIAFSLPIACFNLGAPAERLAEYPHGHVLASQNPAQVLDELIEFHRRLYLQN